MSETIGLFGFEECNGDLTQHARPTFNVSRWTTDVTRHAKNNIIVILFHIHQHRTSYISYTTTSYNKVRKKIIKKLKIELTGSIHKQISDQPMQIKWPQVRVSTIVSSLMQWSRWVLSCHLKFDNLKKNFSTIFVSSHMYPENSRDPE